VSSKKLSSLFLILVLVSSVIVLGNSQTISALTPVADLTGQWSGFAQITIPGGYCEYTGKVNAYLKQDGNNIAGEFSWVATGSKSSNPEIYECDYRGQTYSDDVQGTLDGSRITLYSSEASFTGWYASSGIKLDIVFGDSSIGITQLSPVNFTPPSLTPKGGDDEAKKKDVEEKKKAEEAKKLKAAEEEKKKKATGDVAKKKAAGDVTKKKAETKSKFIEPPSPSVFEINEKAKPFFKALWDGKCDALSHQWELLTTKSGRVPIVCTGGSIALPTGEIVQFSIGDKAEVELIKWGVKGLFAKFMYVGIAKDVRDFIRLSRDVAKITNDVTGAKAAYDKIESMKALNLLITKGEGELFGGVIKFKFSCPTGECKFIRMEEEGGGFKLEDVPSTYYPKTKKLEATVNHNSVYILVEYAPAEIQEKTPKQTPTTPTPQSTKFLSYENKQYGFSIKYPSNWEKDEELESNPTFPEMLGLVSFEVEGATFALGLIQDDKGFSQTISDKLKNEVGNSVCTSMPAEVTCSIKVLEKSFTHKNGYGGKSTTLLITISDGKTSIEMPMTMTMIPHGKNTWAMFSVASPIVSNAEQLVKDVTRIGESFKIHNYQGAASQSSIITESSAGTLTLNSNEFTVSKYSPVEAIVSGHVNSYERGVVLTLKIVKPDKSSVEHGIVVTKDGNFRLPLKLDSNWPAGNYQILAKYGSQDLGSVSFLIKKS